MLELGSLVRRDHDDLHYALRVITEPLSDEAEVGVMLERLATAFPAHAEAETVVLAQMLGDSQPPPALYFLVSQVIASHLAQERALAELMAVSPRSPAFRERARYLRHLMVHHADHEAACLLPALPDHLPRDVWRGLATRYTAERERLLAELAQPADAALRRVG